MFSPKINLPQQIQPAEDSKLYILISDVEKLSTKVSLTATGSGSKARAENGDFTTKTVAAGVNVYDSIGNVVHDVFADVAFQTNKIDGISNIVGAVKLRG